jgi:CRISPR-associated endonuclease Csy4
MKYYIEITLRPDAEIGIGFLWQKMYQQLHLALVEVKDENEKVDVGIAFPQYGNISFPLGHSMRLFGRVPDDLSNLRLEYWLKRLLDYVSITEMKEVPNNIENYASFYRQQVKSNPERLARRQAKRKGISLEEAMLNYETMPDQISKLPFIIIESLSSAQKLKLFIQKERKETLSEGKFNTFGLSKDATVPWF